MQLRYIKVSLRNIKKWSPGFLETLHLTKIMFAGLHTPNVTVLSGTRFSKSSEGKWTDDLHYDEVRGDTTMKYGETLRWSTGRHYDEVRGHTTMKYGDTLRWSTGRLLSAPHVSVVEIWPRGYKTFFLCSTQLSMKFVLLINLELLTISIFFLINIAEHENFSANKYENANYCWHFHIY